METHIFVSDGASFDHALVVVEVSELVDGVKLVVNGYLEGAFQILLVLSVLLFGEALLVVKHAHVDAVIPVLLLVLLFLEALVYDVLQHHHVPDVSFMRLPLVSSTLLHCSLVSRFVGHRVQVLHPSRRWSNQ